LFNMQDFSPHAYARFFTPRSRRGEKYCQDRLARLLHISKCHARIFFSPGPLPHGVKTFTSKLG
jgi:hypothetical protein